MHKQLMEDLVLKSNLLMESLMYLTILSILATVFVQAEVVSLPLFKDAVLHEKNLEDSYPCFLVNQFLQTHVVKFLTAVSEGQCFIHQNIESSDKKIRNIWSVVKG